MEKLDKESLCKHQSITLKELAELGAKYPLAIIGGAQRGKTTLMKYIVREMTRLENIKIRIWDSSVKWLFESPATKAYVIPQPSLVIYQGNKPVSYEYSQQISDEELAKILEDRCVVFDISELDDIEYEREFQRRVIHCDKEYLIKLTKQNRGEIRERIVHVTEEAQGSFTSNSLRQIKNLWLAKVISVGANYGLNFHIVTRRPSEVSTQVFEHTSVKCIAQTNQPNDIRKLKTMFNWKTVEAIKKLGLGEFVVLTPDGIFYYQTTVYRDKIPQIYEFRAVQEQGKISKLKTLAKKLLRKIFRG